MSCRVSTIGVGWSNLLGGLSLPGRGIYEFLGDYGSNWGDLNSD